MPGTPERRKSRCHERRLFDCRLIARSRNRSIQRAATPERVRASFVAISAVSSSASVRVMRPISRAVVSAIRRLPRSIARLKVALGCPCAVNAAFPGRTAVRAYRGLLPGVGGRLPRRGQTAVITSPAAERKPGLRPRLRRRNGDLGLQRVTGRFTTTPPAGS
jgi:hypothetical protein